MILKRLYEEAIAQASFLVGCSKAREAIVIDPNRDVDQYLRAAAAENVRITGVAETHIHADFVSGSRELAARTGAQLYLSDAGDDDWKYAFADDSNVTRVREGSVIRAGSVRLNVLHTPGHTPEHICFGLTDEAATEQPQSIFTGDFVFVGDVGRPDLLERAAHRAGTMEEGARTLYRSLQEFKRLPGHLLLWPSHGAGSACGKSLSGVPVTTLAYELSANWGLRASDEAAFVEDVLAGQPEPPTYFKEMKRINQAGPPFLEGFRMPPRLELEGTLDAIERGEVFVDLRRGSEFEMSFIPGVLNIPKGEGFATWAGWLLPYDRPVHLLAGHASDVATCVRELALIGIDDVAAWGVTGSALIGWAHRHGAPETLPHVAATDVMERVMRGEAVVLDVRSRGEYLEGHVPGAFHIPVGQITARASELPADQPIAVHCAGGSRSPIALSVLRRLGMTRLADIPGGFTEYAATGLPIEVGEPREAVAR